MNPKSGPLPITTVRLLRFGTDNNHAVFILNLLLVAHLEDTHLVVAPKDVDDQEEEEEHEGEEEEEEASIREETLPPQRPYRELDRNVVCKKKKKP